MVSCRPTVSSDSKALTADSSIVFTHEQHQFYYTAGWQIAEELVDENWSEMGACNVSSVNSVPAASRERHRASVLKKADCGLGRRTHTIRRVLA